MLDVNRASYALCVLETLFEDRCYMQFFCETLKFVLCVKMHLPIALQLGIFCHCLKGRNGNAKPSEFTVQFFSEQGRVCLPALGKLKTPQHVARTSAMQMHFRTPTDFLFRMTGLSFLLVSL